MKKENDIAEYLNLPSDYKITANDAFAILKRFKEATFGSDKPISPISFAYYYDKFGNFIEPKTHYDYIVNDMFDNLNSSDRFMLLKYFNSQT